MKLLSALFAITAITFWLSLILATVFFGWKMLVLLICIYAHFAFGFGALFLFFLWSDSIDKNQHGKN